MAENLKQTVLDNLDVLAVYLGMGIKVANQTPSADGWISVHAIDREDKNPSARINVGQGTRRGRYYDFKYGESKSIFDMMIGYGGCADFKSALKELAGQAGVKLPTKWKPTETRLDKIEFRDWNDPLGEFYGQKKPPITNEALKRAGARRCMWQNQACFALPIYGPFGTEDDPVGWSIHPQNGKMLSIFKGKDTPPDQAKNVTPRLDDSIPTFVGTFSINNIKDADIVFKVEGVTDMLAGMSIVPESTQNDYVFITNPNGCSENPNADQLHLLEGKKVYVIGDADKPGIEGAKKWAKAIASVAEEVKILTLPYPEGDKHGSDLRDFFVEGKGLHELLELADDADPVEPPEDGEVALDFFESEDERICNLLNIDVLGMDDEGKVHIFSSVTKRKIVIKDADRLNYSRALGYFGSGPVRDHIARTAEDQTNTKFVLKRVCEAICAVAGNHNYDEENIVGAGLWRGTDDDNSPSDAVLMISKQRAYRFNGTGEMKSLDKSNVDNLIIDFGTTEWVSKEKKLLEYIGYAEDVGWRGAVVDRLKNDVFGLWNFTRPRDVELCTGLFLATIGQTLWHWRPMVAVSGKSESGKSKLCHTIQAMLGDLTTLIDNETTEAAIRQQVNSRSVVVVVDEFEKSKHRKAILQLLRSSSRGGIIYRGSATHKAVSFRMKHLVWTAAIEAGLMAEADANRWIVFELLPGDTLKNLPGPAELQDLGLRAIAVVIRCIIDAVSTHETIINSGMGTRQVESYSVPASILTSIRGGNVDTAAGVLSGFLEDLENEGESEVIPDEDQLLEDILAAPVDLGRGQKESVQSMVMDLLADTSTMDSERRSTMWRHGVFADRQVNDMTGKKEPVLYLVVKGEFAISRCLLSGTRWQGMNIDQIIRRLDGVEKIAKRVQGVYRKCRKIPWCAFDEVLDPQSEIGH